VGRQRDADGELHVARSMGSNPGASSSF
jgi:hypothetical protein